MIIYTPLTSDLKLDIPCQEVYAFHLYVLGNAVYSTIQTAGKLSITAQLCRKVLEESRVFDDTCYDVKYWVVRLSSKYKTPTLKGRVRK